MATNRRLINIKDTDYDFYPTPEWGTRALLYYEKFKGVVEEVCCGEGDISKILINKGYKVKSSDLIDRGYGKQQDFLKRTKRIQNVCTNPPFNIANEILLHAISLTDGKICLLLRTAFLESITRYNEVFRKYPPVRVYTFAERLSMYKRTKKGEVSYKGGGTTSYSWFIWDMQANNTTTQLLWIKPGFKKGIIKSFHFSPERLAKRRLK